MEGLIPYPYPYFINLILKVLVYLNFFRGFLDQQKDQMDQEGFHYTYRLNSQAEE